MKRLLALICSVFAVMGTAQYISVSANPVTTLETTNITTTTVTTVDPIIYQKVAELFTSVSDIQALVNMLNQRLDGMDISVAESNDKITNLDGSVGEMFAQISDMQNAEPVVMSNQSNGGNSGGTNLKSNSSEEKATTTETSKIVVKKEETTTTPKVTTTTTTPTETTVSADTDGNASLLEDTYFGKDRQFITVTTKDGNVFYILIDKGAGDENNVYFLNKVDVADLNALLSEGENGGTQIVTTVAMSENESAIDGSAVTTTSKTTSQQKKAGKSNKTLYIVLGAGIPLFIVGYYFIKIKPKKSKKGFSEDFDFEEEQDEQYEKDENEEDEQ